jgi:hypothetical protein
MKQQTEISLEIDRLMVVSRQELAGNTSHETNLRPYIWCVQCGDYVRPLSTDEAALQAHVTSLTIFHWVESESLHYVESLDGLLLICTNSLSNK